MTSYRVRIIGGIDNSVVNSLILPSDCLSVPKHRCLYTLHVACGNSTPFIPSPMDQSLSSPLTQTHHYSTPDTWSPLSITKMKMQRKPRSSTSPSSEHRKKIPYTNAVTLPFSTVPSFTFDMEQCPTASSAAPVNLTNLLQEALKINKVER